MKLQAHAHEVYRSAGIGAIWWIESTLVNGYVARIVRRSEALSAQVLGHRQSFVGDFTTPTTWKLAGTAPDYDTAVAAAALGAYDA